MGGRRENAQQKAVARREEKIVLGTKKCGE